MYKHVSVCSRRLDTVVVVIDVAAAEAPQAALGQRRTIGARVAAWGRCSRCGVVEWRADVAGGRQRGARLLTAARRAGRHDVTVALAVSTTAAVSLALYE